MQYTVKIPAVLGDTCNLSTIAQAMALKPASAAGEWDESTFDAMELHYSRWLREEALSGRLVTCDSTGIPTPWNLLMGGPEPVDVTVACCRAWVNLNQLNLWAHKAGHFFSIQSEGVPWIDHRGVVGGSLDAPITVTIDDKSYLLGLKHHKVNQPSEPEVVATKSVDELVSQDVEVQVGPEPLTTTEIAECFNGLARRNTRGWKDILGKKPKWIEMCLVTHGSRGGSRGGRERRWNPVMLGLALVKASKAKRSSVRGRFQVRPELDSWKDEWMKAEWQLPEE